MAYTDIDKSDDYFNTILWTGDGTSSRALTGLGFQPDMVWTKRRSTADNHHLFDSVRVVSSVPQRLFPNLTNAEDGNFGSLDSFDSDGFTVGSNVATNASGETFVGWSWKAGGTGVSNTDGSISSTVSANNTNGFSIVTYTGTGTGNSTNFKTIGTGLNEAPSFALVKTRDAISNLDDWAVYHKSINYTAYDQTMFLNTTQALVGGFSRGTPRCGLDGTNLSIVGSYSDLLNFDTLNCRYVAYCFAEKKGFSKFGSYKGNGSADGTFVYTGFKPAMIIVKRSDAPEYWNILDTARADVPNANPTDQALYANDSSAEYSETQGIDLVSNGFKVREGGAGWCNASGGTYIYMCFASNPFVTSTGIPTTAR